MEKLIKKIWLWGQAAGSHHTNNQFGLPGVSTMTAMEGAHFYGLSSMCFVVMGGEPQPPFDSEAEKLSGLDKVVWSVVGDSSSKRSDGNADTDAVAAVARKHKNIVGGILDDFMNKKRLKLFPPDALAKIKRDLIEGAGRDMELWAVLYQHELQNDIQAHIDECDVITFWNWYGETLWELDKNMAKVKQLAANKKVLAGCYLWDYGNNVPMSRRLMNAQLDKYYQWLKDGTIDGVIICSNCSSDVGLESVAQMRQWLSEHGEELI